MNNNEKLIEAAANGQTETVRQLLELGADIHADDDAALQSACLAGHFDTATLLLEKGADAHARDEDGYSDAPLHNAASGGHTRIVELLLLDKYDADINSGNCEGPAAALREASRGGHLETVELLLAEGAFIYPPGEYGLGCVLCAAAENGHTSILERLLSSNRDTELYITVSPVLATAAEGGHSDTVELLLTKLHDNDEVVGLALIAAAEAGKTKIIELLLGKKSAIDTNNYAALEAAAVAEHTEIVALLLCKYQTRELGEMLSTAKEPQPKDVIQKEFKKRRGTVVRNAVKSEPGLEI
jgi:ankyrin repeat protein